MEPRHWFWIQAAVIAAAIGIGTVIAVRIVNRPSPALAPVAALLAAPRPLAHTDLPFVVPDVAPTPLKAPPAPHSGGAGTGAGREALASGGASPDSPSVGTGAGATSPNASATDPGGVGETLRTAGDPLSSLKPAPSSGSSDTAPGSASPAGVSPYAPAPDAASSVPGSSVGAVSPAPASSAATPVTGP